MGEKKLSGTRMSTYSVNNSHSRMILRLTLRMISLFLRMSHTLRKRITLKKSDINLSVSLILIENEIDCLVNSLNRMSLTLRMISLFLRMRLILRVISLFLRMSLTLRMISLSE